jgi:hypothetical protein
MKNSWAFEDHPPTKKDPPSHSSYAVKYNARKTSTNSNTSESSNPVTSYAQLHKSKSAKSQSLSTKPVKGGSLGPIVNGANGYSLIYKKGSLGNRATQGIDSNNNLKTPLVRNNSVGAKSLSPFDSHMPKSPVARRKANNMVGLKNNASLSASLPDWSELSNRQKKLLSPVSSGMYCNVEIGKKGFWKYCKRAAELILTVGFHMVVTVVKIESRSFSSAEIQHFRTENTRSD